MTTELMQYETQLFWQRWQRLISLKVRETYIISRLKSLYLNDETIAFLQEFTTMFEGAERLKMLKFCRKVLIQFPDRKRFIHRGHYQAFREEYQNELNNDTTVDGIKWLDEEINYVECVQELDLKIQEELSDKIKATPIMPTSNASEVQTQMDKKEVLAHYKISTSTFDRWRRDGFPCAKVGRKFFVDRKRAVEWVEANMPNRITINTKFKQRKFQAA